MEGVLYTSAGLAVAGVLLLHIAGKFRAKARPVVVAEEPSQALSLKSRLLDR